MRWQSRTNSLCRNWHLAGAGLVTPPSNNPATQNHIAAEAMIKSSCLNGKKNTQVIKDHDLELNSPLAQPLETLTAVL